MRDGRDKQRFLMLFMGRKMGRKALKIVRTPWDLDPI